MECLITEKNLLRNMCKNRNVERKHAKKCVFVCVFVCVWRRARLSNDVTFFALSYMEQGLYLSLPCMAWPVFWPLVGGFKGPWADGRCHRWTEGEKPLDSVKRWRGRERKRE